MRESPQRDRFTELLIDRERWRSLYLHERRTKGDCVDTHCPHLWSVWRHKALQLESLGTRLAMAERALRTILDGRDATTEVNEWRASL